MCRIDLLPSDSSDRLIAGLTLTFGFYKQCTANTCWFFHLLAYICTYASSPEKNTDCDNRARIDRKKQLWPNNWPNGWAAIIFRNMPARMSSNCRIIILFEDVEAIAAKQIEQYHQTENTTCPIFFFDTWLIITKVWFEWVYGTSSGLARKRNTALPHGFVPALQARFALGS